MRGDEAKEKCPELLLASVPCLRGKADTSRYRSAGREVIDVLKKNCNIVERASIDEAYLDITQIVDDKLSKGFVEFEDISKQLNNTYVVGHSECGVNNEEQRSNGLQTWLSEAAEDIQIQRLAVAGAFVENLREEIFNSTTFRCSAGISFNKILAKLACGLHKPNRQTILPASAVPELFGTLPVKKVKNLGGKLGDIVIDSLKCNVMADLGRYSLQYLQNRFDDKTGLWLYNIAQGIDNEPVTPRLVSKSIGASKNFPGKQAIVDIEVLKHWLGELSEEVCERLEQDLEENERRASLLTVSFHYYQNKSVVSQSRSCALTSYKPEKVAEQCLNIVTKATQQLPISYLGLSAGKFIKAKGSENFMNFFKTTSNNKPNLSINNDADKINENSKLNEEIERFEKDIKNTNNNKTSDSNYSVEKEANENLQSSPDNIKVNRRSSPCSSIKKSLKSDNFKKSFFMNILKENLVEKEDSMKNKKIDEESFTKSEINGQAELDNESCNSEVPKNQQNIVENNIQSTSLNSNETQLQNSLSNNNEATVRLQEIFPDLNDIDPNIVKLLPFNLQQEAKKFLKMSEVRNSSTDLHKVKSKESSKTAKGKISKSKPSIQNFFIKTDVNNDTDSNFKKCSQCDQLILINKFDEHNDYHIARNLQKEMNQIISSDESRKRKVNSENPDHLKKRISDEFVIDNVLKTKSSTFSSP